MYVRVSVQSGGDAAGHGGIILELVGAKLIAIYSIFLFLTKYGRRVNFPKGEMQGSIGFFFP